MPAASLGSLLIISNKNGYEKKLTDGTEKRQREEKVEQGKN